MFNLIVYRFPYISSQFPSLSPARSLGSGRLTESLGLGVHPGPLEPSGARVSSKPGFTGALAAAWLRNHLGLSELLEATEADRHWGELGAWVVGAHREPPWARRINLVLGPAGFGVCSEVGAHFTVFQWKGGSLPAGPPGLGVQMMGIGDFIIPTLSKHLLTFYHFCASPSCNTSPGTLGSGAANFQVWRAVQIEVSDGGSALEIPMLPFC